MSVVATGSRRRPLIGLGGRRKTGRQIVGSEEVVYELPVDIYMAQYAQGIHEAGGLPVHLPFDIDISEIVGLLDGLLMPGGTDIDPSVYGAEPDPDLFDTEPIRDTYESELLDAAVARNLPVLGICRGIQLFNVHGGGTLHQHVPEHARLDVGPGDCVHNVEFSDGSIISSLYGKSMKVNSFHHQTIAELAPDLVTTGIADDGTIEAVESTTNPWLGVQWHPEMLPTRQNDPIFRWLVDASLA